MAASATKTRTRARTSSKRASQPAQTESNGAAEAQADEATEQDEPTPAKKVGVKKGATKATKAAAKKGGATKATKGATKRATQRPSAEEEEAKNAERERQRQEKEAAKQAERQELIDNGYLFVNTDEEGREEEFHYVERDEDDDRVVLGNAQRVIEALRESPDMPVRKRAVAEPNIMTMGIFAALEALGLVEQYRARGGAGGGVAYLWVGGDIEFPVDAEE